MTTQRVIYLFLAALLVRGLALPYLPAAYPVGSDPYYFGLLASNLAAGYGLTAGGFSAAYPPLYPMLLSAIPVGLLNPAIDLCIAATLLAIGKAMDRDAFWPAAIYLFWPPAILTTLTPQKDTLAILVVSLVALACLKVRKGERGVWIGISGGLLALTQPAFAPVAPVLFLALCWGKWRQGFAAAAAMFIVLAPWWIRNWLIFGAFVPLTSSTGYNLFVAADGYYHGLKRFTPLGELEGSHAAARAALDLWRADPLTVAFHRIAAPAKAMLMERAFYDMAYWLPAYHAFREAVFWPVMLYWWGVLATAALRIRQAPHVLWIIIAAACVELAVFNFWFEFGERHRYLLVPFVFLAAGLTPRSAENREQDTRRARRTPPARPAT